MCVSADCVPSSLVLLSVSPSPQPHNPSPTKPPLTLSSRDHRPLFQTSSSRRLVPRAAGRAVLVAANIINRFVAPFYAPSASRMKRIRSSAASSPLFASAACFWADLAFRTKLFFQFDLPEHARAIQTVHALALLRNCCIKFRWRAGRRLGSVVTRD